MTMSNLQDTDAVNAFVFGECKRCNIVSRNEKKKGIMVFICSSASNDDKLSTVDNKVFGTTKCVADRELQQRLGIFGVYDNKVYGF